MGHGYLANQDKGEKLLMKSVRSLALPTLAVPLAAVVSYAFTSNAFYSLDPVAARLAYLAFWLVGQVIILVKKDDRYVISGYILWAVPWTVLFFQTEISVVLQFNTLPTYLFDVYLGAYRTSAHIPLVESRGEYIGFYFIAYLIGLVTSWNYPATILILLSFNFSILFVTAYLYFRMLRKICSFALAYIFSSTFVVFSLMLNYLWIFSGPRLYAFILFLLFSLLILKYGVDSRRSALIAILFLIDLGISVTDAGISYVMCVFCLFLWLVTRRGRRALLFALPPISYLVFLTSMQYVRDVAGVLAFTAYMWIRVVSVAGPILIQSSFSIHLGTSPFYEKLGEVVFSYAFQVVLAIVALYTLQNLLRLRGRDATRFGLPAFQGTFLFFYTISILAYLANRMLPQYVQGDYGIIAIAIAGATVPITILPMSNSIQRMLGDRAGKWRLPWIHVPARRLLAVSLLILVMVSSLGNGSWFYPKSARDEVVSLAEWDTVHQVEMYAVYNVIHNRGDTQLRVLVSRQAVVVYAQRLSYGDHIETINVAYDDRPALYSATIGVQLIALPNHPSLSGIIDVSNVVFSDGAELLLTKTPLTDQFISGQLASLNSR